MIISNLFRIVHDTPQIVNRHLYNEFMDKIIQECIESLNNHYHHFPSHTESILYPLINLPKDRSFQHLFLIISFFWWSPFNDHCCLQDEGQIPWSSSEAIQGQVCVPFLYSFFLQLSSPCKYFTKLLCWFTSPRFCPSCFLYQDCSFSLAFCT